MAFTAVLFTLPVIAEPADSQPAMGDLSSGARGRRPSAALPGPPRALPETIPLPAFTRSAELSAARPPFLDSVIRQSSAIAPHITGRFERGGLAGRLLARMKREAQRYRRENVSVPLTAATEQPFDEGDSIASDRRSEEAERIVTRSARRTLDLELERLARRSLGLGPTLDLFGRLSTPGFHPESLAVREPPGGGARSARQDTGRPGRLTGSVGLRLDAHPALVMRATFLGIQGRLEVPARNDPVRLSLERPVGPRGRAALTSGVPRDGTGWATLTFNFRF